MIQVSRLVLRRRAIGVRSAREMAAKLKVSKVHLSQIEAGSTAPGEELQRRMCRAYGLGKRELEVLVLETQVDYHTRSAAYLRSLIREIREHDHEQRAEAAG